MKIIRLITPFLFGLIGIFSFAPFSIKLFIFISYAYLINLFLSKKTNSFWKVFAWGLGHWGFGMSWIIVSVYYYGETTIAISLFIYTLLITILTLVFTIPLLLLKPLLKLINTKNNLIQVLFISSILIISELSRYYFLNGVPWLIPGNIYLDTYVQNIYPIFGVIAASLLIYFLCTLFIVYRNKNLSYVALIIIVLSLIPEYKSFDIDKGIKISIIQPASDPFLKYESNYFYQIEKKLDKLITKVSDDTKLIVVPEAELPYPLESPRFNNFIKNTAISKKMLIGAWLYEDNKLYNSIYSPKYNEMYKKSHLVPFGEYIPFIDGLRGMIDFFDLPMSNVSHGSKNQQNIHILEDIEVSSPICFDIAFPNTIRKMNKSSLLMVNISNDTWFGNSIGPYQHLSIARVRALENNKWTIRSTNDGVSAIISNKGTIVDYLDKGRSDILEGHVQFLQESSFYSLTGYKFIYLLAFMIVFIIICLSLWKNQIKKR